MFLKVYDTDYNNLGLIKEPIDLKVEKSLKTGTQSLSFSLPLNKHNIEIINEELT